MPHQPITRTPAAERHLLDLLTEVHALEAAVAAAGRWHTSSNVFLYGYDDIMSRCPDHAREEVTAAFLGLVQRTKLADPKHPPLYLRAPRREVA